MTLDDVLPSPEWRTRHERRVGASPGEALTVARAVTLADMPLGAVLLGIRSGRLRRPSRVPFVALVESRVGMIEVDEHLWTGVQRPWRKRGESRPVEDFATFAESGWVKIAMNLTATPAPGGARLATETRICATSEDARRTFGRYWLAVRVGSDLVRISWLRAVDHRLRSPGPEVTVGSV